MESIIRLESERLGYGKVVLSNPHGIEIDSGITAIYGDNGSGKTTLGTILEKGRYAYGNRLWFNDAIKAIKMLSFTDIHALSGMEAQYHAQRMEATMNDMIPTVREIMGEKIESDLWEEYAASFALIDAEDKKINYLSSGELRKLLIINALIDKPDVLILDNPYIGLDSKSRIEFDNTMIKLRDNNISVIMMVCDSADIPSYTDRVIILDNLVIAKQLQDKEEISALRQTNIHRGCEELTLPQMKESSLPPHSVAFSIRNGHVRYGARDIIKDFDWEVRRGEKWVLKGPNGSGKSLLLSLVCADNPQAYANDITLFDRRRGSGESIWEIKNNIGYVSPEMQLFFKSGSPVRDIIIQGMRTSLNKYRPANQEEILLAGQWMRLLAISHLADRHFTELSSGEQRLVLIAAAMIRQPALLVLDEPLHGLDANRKTRVKQIVTNLTNRNNTSLIYVTHYDSEIPECITHTKTIIKS